jgi:hypothetical protein
VEQVTQFTCCNGTKVQILTQLGEQDPTPHELKWNKYDGPFALPRPGLFEETICESWRIRAIAKKENCSDSEITEREFAVVIHEKDKKRILMVTCFKY